jgi:hypothetical protein
MAEIWGLAAAAVVGAGAAVYTGNKAAGATRSAANSATGENARQFDTIRSDTAAQRRLGEGATGILSRLYGLPVYDPVTEAANSDVLIGDQYLPPGTTVKNFNGGWGEVFNGDTRVGTLRPGRANGIFLGDQGVDIPALALKNKQATAGTAITPATASPDFSAFFDTPDYQFNKSETLKALDRSLLARGKGLSGAGVKEGERYASGLASQQFGDTFNRLTALAGIGQAATNTSAQAGLTTASNNSQILANAGNQRASAYMQTGEGVSNAVTGGLSNYLFLQQLNKNPYGGTPSYAGGNVGMYNGGGMRLT